MTKSKTPELSGHLGPLHPAGLLQSIAMGKLTGMLKVDDGPNLIVVHFDFGSLTHARMGKLKGQRAIRSFVLDWTRGLFQFFDGSRVEKLPEDCAIKKPLDKLLLDCFNEATDGNKKTGQVTVRMKVLDDKLAANVANYLKCSFCGKSKDEVKKLVAGPNVYICDACIRNCDELMDEP
ncbi:MAG: hypothetical protein C5B53_04480 [Candidatus Melainabacteria bacterium]|nr:MAG: hypothetical protein C5B53_04480 [Candidatus Melainabacteria bacterium]